MASASTTTVRIRFGSPMPSVCCICGEQAEHKTCFVAVPNQQPVDKGQLAATAVGYGIGGPLGILTAALMSSAVQRENQKEIPNQTLLKLPVCSRHRRFPLFKFLEFVLWVAGIIFLSIASAWLGPMLTGVEGSALASVVVFVVGIIALFIRWTKMRMRLRKLDAVDATFDNAAKAFARQYDELNGRGMSFLNVK